MGTTANTNCLKGFRCPKCGSEGPFKIEATCLVLVHDDGIEDGEGYEWDDSAWCACRECEHDGTVRDFTIAAAEEVQP